MINSRHNRIAKALVTGTILAFATAVLWAEEETERSEGVDEVIEEVVVRANKPGDRIDIEARYASLWRSRVTRDLERMRILEEEYQWRKSETETTNSSRIKWGYDPRAELRMRRSSELMDLPFEYAKPATLFRFEF